MNETQQAHFRDAIRAVKESQHAEDFTMLKFAHNCGTPACVLGTYAARADMQSMFALVKDSFERDSAPEYRDKLYLAYAKHPALIKSINTCNAFVDFNDLEFREYFGLEKGEGDELFGADGCDQATTIADAVEYLERFLAFKLENL